MTQQELSDAFWADYEAHKEEIAAEIDAQLVAAFELPTYHISLDDWTLWVLAQRMKREQGTVEAA